VTDLTAQKCEACRVGAPTVTAQERLELHKEIPEWEIIDVDDVPQLRRAYAFPDFAEALSFTDDVGAIAEEEGHHPAILTEYGKVTVRWWTHKIGGLHRNDFIMAARTEQLFEDL